MDQWRERLEAIRNKDSAPIPRQPVRAITEAEMALIDSLTNFQQHRQENQNQNINATNELLVAVLTERQSPEMFERGVALAMAVIQAAKAMSEYWKECIEIGIGHRRLGPRDRDSARDNNTPYQIWHNRVFAEAQKRTGIRYPI